MPKIPGGFKSTSSGVLKPWRQSGDPGRSNLLSFCLCSMMYSLKVGLLEWQRFKEISYVYLHNTPIAVQMLRPQPVVSLSLASNMIRTGYPHRTATLVRHQLPKRWHLSKGFRHGLQGTTLATSWHLQFKGRPTLTQPNKHHGRGCCVPPCRSSTMA